jgi:hypothetical protein
MFRLLLTVCLCIAPLAAAIAESLCTSEETSLFTCAIGKKVVSVCSSNDLSAASGYVQYRFGREARKPELVYPAQKAHPRSYFSWGFEGSAKSQASADLGLMGADSLDPGPSFRSRPQAEVAGKGFSAAERTGNADTNRTARIATLLQDRTETSFGCNSPERLHSPLAFHKTLEGLHLPSMGALYRSPRK